MSKTDTDVNISLTSWKENPKNPKASYPVFTDHQEYGVKFRWSMDMD